MAGHPGAASTFFITRKNYWWPHQKEFVRSYVRGCATCQQNKTLTKPQKPPLFPITPETNPGPFTTISIDWITKLPISEGWDSILTITDHDCSKAVIFIPCKETMGMEELAKQYFKWVFPHYGIPNKIISDRDPWVMSDLTKAICEGNIWQNISTAYHPQTDGQLEQTNQMLETYLQIFCGHQQDDWAIWLPIAQYVLNSRPSHMTKVSPFETLIGIILRGLNDPAIQESDWDRITNLKNARAKAHKAILHSQMLITRDGNFKPYKEGELVWLDARNLQTSHPSHKLRAKRYGPFEITKALSHITYQLKLPPLWKIHNTFHATYLSPFKETQEHGPNFLEPPPEIIEGQEEWEVKEIINRRFFGKKKKQYLVKWKGYSDAHNTWEPEENIFTNELVQQYKGRHKQGALAHTVAQKTVPMFGHFEKIDLP